MLNNNSLDLFNKVERRLKNKKQALEDMENEYSLLEKHAYQLYKSNVSYFHLSKDMIDNINKWLKMLDEKLDKRKRYAEQKIFNYITGYLTEVLKTPDLITITDIIYYGLPCEGAYIRFISCNEHWALYVPFIDKVPFNSFQMYGDTCFKLTLYREISEHHRVFKASTFIEEELGGEINEENLSDKINND